MIIVTSLSPNHSNAANQQAAIDSWFRYGKCYSMNAASEIPQLEYKGIEILPTTKTMAHLFGKPLVNVHAIFEFALSKKQDLLLINSDILITELPEFLDCGISIMSRFDYDTDIQQSKKFENGFDAFFIPYKFLHIFPLSIYALGSCWHDYYTPMVAIKNNVPVYSYHNRFTFHKLHQVQYPVQEYFDIGEFFKWEFKINKKLLVPQVAAQTIALIKSKIIYL